MSVTVRLSVESDKDYLYKWLLDPEILPWFPLENAREVEDAVRICMSYVEMGAAFTGCIDGKPCGMAVLYLQKYKKLKHQCLFVIVVDKEHRGRGIGTKIFERMKQDAKDKFGIEILHLEVYLGNPAQKLYEKLGFREYGRQDHFLKERDGTYRDKINMELYL